MHEHEFDGLIAKPSATTTGAVIVLPDEHGLDDHAQQVCNRLATVGWFAVAPREFNIDAAIDYAHELGIEDNRCALLGFSGGGTRACVESTKRKFGAAVSFYPLEPECLSIVLPKLKTPWLGFVGGGDDRACVSDWQPIQAAASQASCDCNIVFYEHAHHFFFRDDQKEHFDLDAAPNAWRNALGWLDHHVIGDQA